MPPGADVADTAVAIARVRAEEGRLPVAERLFDDPFAALFADADETGEVTARLLSVPFLRASVRLRTRFIDDTVRAALADSCRQLVVLGVGFDCRALRLPELRASGVRVFEVDLPAQLARKARILEAAGVATPAGVAAVACDFAAWDFDVVLAGALVRAGYQIGAPAVFVWEGVVGYLDDAAIDRTLALVGRLGGPGTRLAFNYQLHRFDPAALRARVAAAGFGTLDDVACADLHRGLLGGEPPAESELFRIAVARK